MSPTERRKAIDTAIAIAATHPVIPAAVRAGLAAMGEELAELRVELERMRQFALASQGSRDG